jgi:hypothetical protein
MAFIEDNPATAALLGVLLGALIGFIGSAVSARVTANQAEKDRLQARRQDWLNRLASAVAEIDTIRGRLTAVNIRASTVQEPLRVQAWESLEKQQEVRRELRTVGLLAGAGGDVRVAEECAKTEQRLSEFINAVYAVYESVRGTEDPSIVEPRLGRADGALGQAVEQLSEVLGSLNRPKD